MSEIAGETMRTERPPAAQVVATWFDQHSDTIHAYVSRRAGHDVASDVTAATFRVALEQIDQFDPRVAGERAWLYGIASNLLRRHWREERRRLRAYERHANVVRGEAIDPLVPIDDRVDAERRFLRLAGAIERLDPVDRDLLFLVAWERCTSAEVAAALELTASTVRRRLQRIRTELRRAEGTVQ
mgnify:CR=1 FL=1